MKSSGHRRPTAKLVAAKVQLYFEYPAKKMMF